MEPSIVRDTAAFVALYVAALVGIGVLVAVVLDRSPPAYLFELFTDPSWVFVSVLGVLVWLAVYPKVRRTYRETMN